MRSTRKSCSVIYYLLLLISLPIVVSANNASDYFQQGISASRSNDYQQAVVAFEKAQQAGMDITALHYNLGVSYYKLGRYAEAEMSFKRLIDRPKMTSLAHYNLGLVALKQQDNEKAKAWFGQSLATTDDSKLLALNKKALRQLGISISSVNMGSGPESPEWHGMISTSYGWDDNVGLDGDERADVSRVSDTAYGLFAKATTYLSGERNNGYRLDVVADILKYDENKPLNNDFNAYRVSFAKEQLWGEWKTRVRARFQQDHFGGEPYSHQIGLELRGKTAVSSRSTLQVRYRYIDISAQSTRFDYIVGTRQQFRARFYLGKRRSATRFEYRLDVNDREDLTIGNVAAEDADSKFRSTSPTRHSFRITKFLPIQGKWSGELDLRYRNSQYKDDDILVNDYQQLNLDKRVTRYQRQEDQYRLGIKLNYAYSKDLDLYTEYRYTDNQSNRMEYVGTTLQETTKYNRTQVTIGLMWFF